MNAPRLLTILFCVSVLAFGCRTTSKPGLFSRKTPHELYGKKITDAGLHSTALGRSWFQAADEALTRPVNIVKPHLESGFFSAERPAAAGLRFTAQRGEKVQVTLSKKPASGQKLYLDLWKVDTITGSAPKLVASSDTTGIAIQFEVEEAGFYLLRLQPELLQNVEYTVQVSAVASLAYPIRAPGKNHIQSFWGADRDAGARRHEGIDIFAKRLTPVVAAADGRVTRVNQNNLGGKVVWLRPENKNFTLYYAHLDSQLVTDGQKVKIGDTLGLMGNTGNARTTAPHLHFGIYASGGAIDPFPFVNPDYPAPAEIRAKTTSLGSVLRVAPKAAKLHDAPDPKSRALMLTSNTALAVEAVTGNWYRVRLPDGVTGYINEGSTSPLKAGKVLKLDDDQKLLVIPDSVSPARKNLAAGSEIRPLAEFGKYRYVRTENDQTGWIEKDGK